MIYIDRQSIPVPDLFMSEEVRIAQENARHFFSRVREDRLQTRFEFDAKIWNRAMRALTQLFRGKCGYCESLIPEGGGVVDHFRPLSDAVGLDARSNADGYWWLAYQWENLYLACVTCSRNKGHQFPVAGEHAIPETLGDALIREHSLLLDPCLDDAESYFSFERSGHVKEEGLAATNPIFSKSLNRGRSTIEVFGLNRINLIQMRQAVIVETRRELSRATSAMRVGGRWDNLILEVIAPSRSYLALRRQFLYRWSSNLQKSGSVNVKARISQVGRTSAEIAELFRPPSVQLRAKNTLVETRSHRRVSGSGRKQASDIERIEIKNFRAIHHLVLDLTSGTRENGIWRAGWKVLLGENGTGKTSILQAIALTLMGPEYVAKLGLSSAAQLRKLPKSGKRARSGYVRLKLSTESKYLEMRFDAKSFRFDGDFKRAHSFLFIRAFGPNRLLPTRDQRGPRSGGNPLKIDNLMNPFLPACDVEGWFSGLRDPDVFGSAAMTIKDLFAIDSRSKIFMRDGQVMIPLGRTQVALDELSGGYQSVLVLAADIIQGFNGKTHDLRRTAGVVLVDEIDAHLHPRWKMRVVDDLRRTFPGMQFIVSTHEPLCLKGVSTGEIVVMRRTGSRVELIDKNDLPSPAGLRVDQLLTSRFFGLHTTIDPDLEEDFEAYYTLLVKRDLSKSETQAKIALKHKLAEVGVLGNTRRDRLMYELIDKYLAKEDLIANPAQRTRLKEKTKREIKAIWKKPLPTSRDVR